VGIELGKSIPTIESSLTPTGYPTNSPTSVPSDVPSSIPTMIPTSSPSASPTREPTSGPVFAPITAAPSFKPTIKATPSPTTIDIGAIGTTDENEAGSDYEFAGSEGSGGSETDSGLSKEQGNDTEYASESDANTLSVAPSSTNDEQPDLDGSEGSGGSETDSDLSKREGNDTGNNSESDVDTVSVAPSPTNEDQSDINTSTGDNGGTGSGLPTEDGGSSTLAPSLESEHTLNTGAPTVDSFFVAEVTSSPSAFDGDMLTNNEDSVAEFAPSIAPIMEAATKSPASSLSELNEICRSSDEIRREQIYLKTVELSGSEVFDDSSTPHSNAATWLMTADSLEVCAHDKNMIQRYVLALFYYTTSGHSWALCSQRPSDTSCPEGVARFLSGASECEWHGITCDNEGSVSNINLGMFSLMINRIFSSFFSPILPSFVFHLSCNRRTYALWAASL